MPHPPRIQQQLTVYDVLDDIAGRQPDIEVPCDEDSLLDETPHDAVYDWEREDRLF